MKYAENPVLYSDTCGYVLEHAPRAALGAPGIFTASTTPSAKPKRLVKLPNVSSPMV